MGRRIRWMGLVMILLLRARAGAAGQPPVSKGQRTGHRGGQSRGTDCKTSTMSAVRSWPPTERCSPIPRRCRTPRTDRLKYQRVYPESTAQLFSDIVGYDSSLYGTWGAEYQYNDQLVSHQQPAFVRPAAQPAPDRPPTTSPSPSIPSLQELAQQELAGRDGAVVVLNPTTGAVLAMYSDPPTTPTVAGLALHLGREPRPPGRDPPGRRRVLPRSARATNADLPARVDLQGGHHVGGVRLPAGTWRNKSYPVLATTPLPNSNRTLPTTAANPAAARSPRCCRRRATPATACWASTSGGTDLSAQATVRVQPGSSPRPARRVPSDFPTSVSSTPRRPGVPGLLGHRPADVAATPSRRPSVAAGIANGGVIMTPHVMAQIRDAQGNLVTNYGPTPWMRATTQARRRPRSPPSWRGWSRRGTAARVGFPPRTRWRPRPGPPRPASVNNTGRLDDRLRPGHQPAGGGRRGRPVPAPSSPAPRPPARSSRR